MTKRKISKIIATALVLVMLFSTNVFAAEQTGYEADAVKSEIARAYEIPEHSFTRTFERSGEEWGYKFTTKVTVLFTIAYTYSDGSWSEINYVDIDVKSVTTNGSPVKVSSIYYYAGGSSAYRVIEIGETNKRRIKININVDEYGDVSTFAEWDV